MTETFELARPFPQKYIHDDGRGNSYVPHHIVTQRLIHIFGTTPKIEILRELYDEGKLTGVIMRLTVPGHEPVEEAGEADNPQSKTNGARAKDACSDAIKRCAMRLGLGLSLWAQKEYFLFDALTKEAADEGEASAAATPDDIPTGPTETEAERPAPTDRSVQETPPLSEGPDVEAEVQRMTEAISKSSKNGKTKVEDNGEAGEGESGEGSRPSPVLVAKRMRFRQMCKKANVDPDECAAEIGAISLEKASLEQVEALISQRGAA